MDSMIHIDGAATDTALEAMAAAIVGVMAAAHDYRIDPSSTSVALSLLGRVTNLGSTSITNCQFTGGLPTPAMPEEDQDEDEDD